MPEQVAVRVPPFEAISHLTRRIAAHGKASEALVDVLSLSYEPALAMILDVLVPFSTSGTSRNVLNAISTARGLGMKTLGISGRRGFGLACDLDIVAPGETTALVQEMHLLIVHLLMEGIERHVQAQPRPTL